MKEAIRNIFIIAKRELGGFFASPMAYVFTIIFLILLGFFTFMVGQFFERGQATLEAFFMWHPWLFLVLVPAVGMGLWAEERRVGTIELLLTMPVSPWQAILGKYLASWAFFGLTIVLTFPVWITVNYLGDPDNGVIFAGYIGSLLMGGAFLSITCATSAMTRSQVISFIVSVVACLFLILAGWPPVTEFLRGHVSQNIVDLVASFSVMPHFENFQLGILDSRDVLFFLSLIGFPLFIASVILRNLRAS